MLNDIMAKSRPHLTAEELAQAFNYATDWLGVYVEEVNALNVYPVPDGDTGTNMHLTMQSVRRQLQEENPKSMASLSHAISYGSLLGARGNSGVILSQILKGFADAIKELSNLTAKGCIEALQVATKTAYAAVMKPVEGTILTVIRSAAEGADKQQSRTPLEVLKDAHLAGHEALEKTPEMLPLLKQAGVVDSGGLGLLYVLDGIIACFEDRELPSPPVITEKAQTQFEEEEFGFCTEFLISEATTDANTIRELVQSYGDSLLVVGAEGFIKGHIHTEEPEKLLAMVAKHGKMVRSKIEDMSEQHSEILADVDHATIEVPQSAMVAVSAGYGITKIFRSLGARVVGGGQTNNPSVQDISDAVKSLEAQEIVIMPNNKNIIMAAERVVDIVPEKTIQVLPTRSLGQGLAAALVFQAEDALRDNLARMREAADHALTLEVTTASRNATIEGLDVTEGDFIGLINGSLKVTEKTAKDTLKSLLHEAGDDYEIATLFHNTSLDLEQAQDLVDELSEIFPALEIEVHAGSPDLYEFVVALE